MRIAANLRLPIHPPKGWNYAEGFPMKRGLTLPHPAARYRSSVARSRRNVRDPARICRRRQRQLPAGSGRCVEAALSLNGQTVFKNSARRVAVSSDDLFMRAETQADIDAIKQSVGLLRRHL
jgi:hypothetical protein